MTAVLKGGPTRSIRNGRLMLRDVTLERIGGQSFSKKERCDPIFPTLGTMRLDG